MILCAMVKPSSDLSVQGINMWVAISSEGILSSTEMLHELQRDAICPVMTYKEKDKTILPVFKTAKSAMIFAKMNTPDNYAIAYMEVDNNDLEIAKKEGLVIRKNAKVIKKETSVYVLYLNTEVVTHYLGRR